MKEEPEFRVTFYEVGSVPAVRWVCPACEKESIALDERAVKSAMKGNNIKTNCEHCKSMLFVRKQLLVHKRINNVEGQQKVPA